MTETRKRSLAVEGRPLGGSSVLQGCVCYFPIAVIRYPDKKLLGRERVYLGSELQRGRGLSWREGTETRLKSTRQSGSRVKIGSQLGMNPQSPSPSDGPQSRKQPSQTAPPAGEARVQTHVPMERGMSHSNHSRELEFYFVVGGFACLVFLLTGHCLPVFLTQAGPESSCTSDPPAPTSQVLGL